jgi:hypothetical protein
MGSQWIEHKVNATGQKNMRMFSNEAEALDWLVE